MKYIIAAFLLVGFWLLFDELRFLNVLRDSLQRTRAEVNAASRQRNLADRQSLLQLQEAHSTWYGLEQRLEYSGLKRMFPGLSAEWWLLCNIMAAASAILLFGLAAGLIYGLAAGIILLGSELLWMSVLRKRNLKRTEADLTKLLDFLGNYSVSAGEITGLFGQIGKYMDEPVRSALDACYLEASTTGDSSAALLAMAEKLEHPKFKELVRNMEISSRYCADFSAMVSAGRRSLRDYLRMAQERRGLLREAYINIFLLLGMSVIVLVSVGNLTGTDIVAMMTQTWPGRIGFGVLAAIFTAFKKQADKA